MFLFLLSSVYATPSKCTVQSTQYLEAGPLFVSGDMVNLREEASINSSVLMEVRLGTEVVAGPCHKREKIGQKDGCWHSVSFTEKGKEKKGYLFSSGLTDCVK